MTTNKLRRLCQEAQLASGIKDAQVVLTISTPSSPDGRTHFLWKDGPLGRLVAKSFPDGKPMFEYLADEILAGLSGLEGGQAEISPVEEPVKT